MDSPLLQIDQSRAPCTRVVSNNTKILERFCQAVASVSVPPEHVGKSNFFVKTTKCVGVHCGWNELGEILRLFDDSTIQPTVEIMPETVPVFECDYEKYTDKVNERPAEVPSFSPQA